MNKQHEYFLGCALQGLLANPAIYEKYQEINGDNLELAHQHYKEDMPKMAFEIVNILIKKLNKELPFSESKSGNDISS